MNKIGQTGAIVFLLFIVVLSPLLYYGFKAVFMPARVAVGNINAGAEVIDQTYTGENAIYNYEWFKDTYHKIIAIREQINASKQGLKDFKELYGANASKWDYATKSEYNQKSQIYEGLKYQESNLVEQYNANSEKVNRVIFKDSLPFHVDKMLW